MTKFVLRLCLGGKKDVVLQCGILRIVRRYIETTRRILQHSSCVVITRCHGYVSYLVLWFRLQGRKFDKQMNFGYQGNERRCEPECTFREAFKQRFWVGRRGGISWGLGSSHFLIPCTGAEDFWQEYETFFHHFARI